LFTAASVSESATAKVFCDGLIVNLNPRSPGSCQYVSVCDQLDIICGITIDHEALREMCVQFMEANPTFTDSQTHTEAFIPLSDDSTANWEMYLRNMRKPTTFGDNITLQAMAQFLKVNFCIASMKDNNVNKHLINPSHDCLDTMPLLLLGH
jgi:OTU-like cysteine protease